MYGPFDYEMHSPREQNCMRFSFAQDLFDDSARDSEDKISWLMNVNSYDKGYIIARQLGFAR
jgi:hypothetical protein